MKHLGTQTIETKRLILRRFTLLDCENVFNNWASSERVTKFLTWEPHKNVEETKKVISQWIENYQNCSDFYNWAIILKDDGICYGSISVVSVNDKTKSVETGYALSQKLWGKGIMTEAYKAVISYFFEKVGVLRIHSKHDVLNPASGKVMEKAGLIKEGLLRKAGYNNQGICDVYVYSILKEDYFKNK